MKARAKMDTYKGIHSYATKTLIRELTNERCHFEEITSVEDYGVFFNDQTWRIQSYSFAAGAIWDPETEELIIRDHMQWSLLPKHAPYAKVCWHSPDEDGPAGFYLANLNGKAPDWHLGGEWPEFDVLFDEESENTFVVRNYEMGPDDMIVALKSLGFASFEKSQRD